MVLKSLSKALLLSASLIATNGNAQLSTNPDKFLGNITTNGQVNGAGYGIEYADLWNQITPENESKWQSVQGGGQSSWSWGGVDNCVNYANQHSFPFKFHCMLWGAQYPNWINDLNYYDRKLAVDNWYDNTKSRYSSLNLIDVVNEAVPGHQANTPTWFEPLGGQGVTGYDWIVRAFEMAYERWPEAILIYNDFNTFQWNTQQFIDLVTKIRDAGAPIDAYGCQSHDLGGCSATTLKNSMNNIQNTLKMPMYITEYDIGTTSDANQLRDYKAQIPLLWEADYCAGVTLWGFNYGSTWTDDGRDANNNRINPGHSGIIKNGVDRPAMTWLREYMASDKAKNAKSPYPGMKKPISLYIKPAKYKAPVNEPNLITVRAKMHNYKIIDKVELYVNDKLHATMTKAPYTCEVTPTNTTSKISLKAIVYTNDGKTYERIGGFYGSRWPQHPYTEDKAPLAVPGVLEAEDFDMGGETISYHSSRTDATSEQYREDQEKANIIKGNGGFYVENNNTGDWYDYTVSINQKTAVKFEAIVGTRESAGSTFTILVFNNDGELKKQVDVQVPYTGYRTFTNIASSLGRYNSGTYRLRILYTKGKTFLDKLYIGTTEEAMDIKDIRSQAEGSNYTVFSTSGVQIGQIEAADNAEAIRQVRRLTNTAGIYIIKDNANGKSKTVAIK